MISEFVYKAGEVQSYLTLRLRGVSDPRWLHLQLMTPFDEFILGCLVIRVARRLNSFGVLDTLSFSHRATACIHFGTI